jgi:hypothetical protein
MRSLVAAFLASLMVCTAGAAAIGKPRVFMLNPDHLAEVREHASEPGYRYAAELRALLATADSTIAAGKVYSVTWTDDVPPSGDIHDYFSLSPYWWPDPSKPDGLPYVQRDGETNPERDRISDRKPCEHMVRDVGILARAYYFSGEEKYAAYAGKLLRVWFLDEETRMNPNINHGQMRRGHNLGTKGGIIGTRRFCLLVDSIGLLEESASWTSEDQAALQEWMDDFIDWLLIHPFGTSERRSSNNHGTSYDMQIISLALYAGRGKIPKLVLENHTRDRIRKQIEPDGAQPRELRRTKGWNYCVENIKYFFRIGRMAQRLGIDIYEKRPEDNGGLRDAIEWLLPYTTRENNWPYKQITEWQPERFSETLHVANAVYKGDKMKAALRNLGWETPTLEEFINIPD